MSKTVKVRVAIVVDSSGHWSATGYHKWPDDDAMSCAWEGLHDSTGTEHQFWLTAELPLPEAKEIKATVEPVT